MRRRFSRGALVMLIAALAGVLVTGCGASAAGTAPTARVAHTPTPVSGPSREAVRPDPNFDYGFTVHITSKGFLPHWLVAVCCQAITWQNLTTATVSVVFDHAGVASGPIPPGGTFTFLPKNAQSISYHSGTDASMHAVLQVNQSVES